MNASRRTQAASSPWFKRYRRGPAGRLRLYCIAHAGGGASTFRPWVRSMPEEIELIGVQLPGREERLSEAAFEELGPLVAALADALAPELARDVDLPFALFGESMGSLIAFELARELRRRGAAAPAQLFVAAHRAPQSPMPELGLQELSDAEFIAEVNRRYDAVPQAVAADADLMELLLPPLRADMAVCDTYRYTDEAPLAVSLSAFGGASDHNVSPGELSAWAEQTTGSFRSTVLPGDHFFLTSAREPLLAQVFRTLQEISP